MAINLPLKSCANGCGVPPDRPSLVICRACQDKIGATLRDMLAGMRVADAPPTQPSGGKEE